MSIMVQRRFVVAPGDRAEFERQSNEGLWPTFLHFGAKMVAFGTWSFSGGPNDSVVTNTVYENFEHWSATRAGGPGEQGSFYRDEALMAETATLRPIFAPRGELVVESEARIFDINDEVSQIGAFHRSAATEPASAPPTFGRGSVVSERTYDLHDGGEAEFRRISREHIWPWLERSGGRLIAYGQDPLRPPNEVTTFFAFRSLAEWHRLSRPAAELAPPAEVVQAWDQRRGLVHSQWGKLLAVLTDFGERV